MTKVGFIGTGSMGSILIEAFLEAGAFAHHDVTIHNRTREKAMKLADSYEAVNVVDHASDVVKKSDWIFLCVKPLQILPIIAELEDLLTDKKTIISITSPILVKELEEHCQAQVVRFVPSIVNRALEGPSLVTFGKNIEENNKNQLMSAFSSISRPEIIDDHIIRVASDIASCGPAFISFLVEKLIEAAVEETEIKTEEATNIAEAMLIGYGELLKKNIYNLQTLQDRVNVPGGVTGEGLKVLNDEVGDQFHLLFQATHRKFAEDRQLIKEQLEKKESKE